MLDGRYQPVNLEIAVGASKSDFGVVRGMRVVGVLVPADTEGDTLRFYADVFGDDDTGAVVVNGVGEEIRVVHSVVTLPNFVAIDPVPTTNRGPIPPTSRIAVQSLDSNDSNNPIVQAGAVAVITLVCEPLNSEG